MVASPVTSSAKNFHKSDARFIHQDILDSPAMKPFANAKTAVSLFYDTPLEFRLVNVGFSTFGDYYLYPREKFNAALGHIMHMTILMSHYLGINRLPFQLVYAGSKSHVKTNTLDMRGLLRSDMRDVTSNGRMSSEMPLFLTATNIEAFTIGLTLLNYDIAYLCWTQGVTVPLHLGASSLENLAACCRASGLGRDIHGRAVWFYRHEQSMKNASAVQVESDFDIPLKRLWALHTALRQRSKPTPTPVVVVASQQNRSETTAVQPEVRSRNDQGPSQIQTISSAIPVSLTNAVAWAATSFTNTAVKAATSATTTAVKAATSATNTAVRAAVSVLKSNSSLGFVGEDGGAFSAIEVENDEMVVGEDEAKVMIDPALVALAMALDSTLDDNDDDLITGGEGGEWMFL
ncbi:hypothetical protein HDU83_003513 [Entophlyctis luteolus]|nr:hypothetical protein HDU83_003513 [Entophlyctis luteolus]